MSEGHSAPGWAGEFRGEGIGLTSRLVRAARCGTEQESRRQRRAQAAGRVSDFATRDSLKPRTSATLAIVPSSGFPSPLNAL